MNPAEAADIVCVRANLRDSPRRRHCNVAEAFSAGTRDDRLFLSMKVQRIIMSERWMPALVLLLPNVVLTSLAWVMLTLSSG
jgi:hypothetical protein